MKKLPKVHEKVSGKVSPPQRVEAGQSVVTITLTANVKKINIMFMFLKVNIEWKGFEEIGKEQTLI